MKQIYDFSALNHIFDTNEANDLIPNLQEYIKKNIHGVVFREIFVTMNPDNFTLLSGIVYVHVKRVYSLKSYKAIKEIYTIGAYKLIYAIRSNAWEEFYNTIEAVEKKLYQTNEIESVYTDGTPV